jgi:hypothetical protein
MVVLLNDDEGSPTIRVHWYIISTLTVQSWLEI